MVMEAEDQSDREGVYFGRISLRLLVVMSYT